MHLAAGIRTREAGNRDEVEGVVANTLNSLRHGAGLLANAFGVRFIDWLDRERMPNLTRRTGRQPAEEH